MRNLQFPFFILAEGVEAALSFFGASPFSIALWERVRALGDGDFRGILTWAPAEEDTHLYLEVLGATVTGLSFRGNFLAGALLLTEEEGEFPLATPAFDTDSGATVTALPVGEDMELACLDSTPLKVWFFTQVNLDFFRKDAWPWLV